MAVAPGQGWALSNELPQSSTAATAAGAAASQIRAAPTGFVGTRQETKIPSTIAGKSAIEIVKKSDPSLAWALPNANPAEMPMETKKQQTPKVAATTSLRGARSAVMESG